jgi:hypothetical protein
MALDELSRRAEALHLSIRQSRPSQVTIIGDQAGDHFAFVNGDGLPLFTIEEAEELIAAIEEFGDYEAWLPAYEDRETRDAADAA